MNTAKKLAASVGWLTVSIISAVIFPSLRHIGEQWTNNAGFFRLIALATFGCVFVLAPIVFAALAWLNRPHALYHELS